MATRMVERSTYWIQTGTNTPRNTGDHRYYWIFYYETDKANRVTKFTVDYYLQYHFTSYGDATIPYIYTIPASTSTVYINGSSIGSISSSYKEIEKGPSYALSRMGSKTFTIKHNNDGTASFTFRGAGFKKPNGDTASSGTSTYTAPGNFPEIPSGSVLGNIPSFDIDNGLTVPITKYVPTYYDKLEVLFGSTVLKTISDIGNVSSVNVTFTESELNNIYTTIPTGTTAEFTFRLKTYSTNTYATQIGETSQKNATGNFKIILPSFSTFGYYDAASSIVSLTGSNQIIVKNISNVYITISTSQLATANTRKATISHYVINGATVKSTGGAISYNLGNVATNGVSVQAVDSRGTASPIIPKNYSTFLDYEYVNIPLDKVNIKRNENEVGRLIEIDMPGTWWNGNFGKVNNTLSLEFYYRKTTDTTNIQGKINNVKITTDNTNSFRVTGTLGSTASDQGFDIDSSYTLTLIVKDSTNTGYQVSSTIDPGEPGMAVYKNKVALGNKYDENLGGTQLWGDVYLNGEKLIVQQPYVHKRHIVSAYMDTTFEYNFTAWTSIDAPLDTATIIGNKLSFSDSYVHIGEGVSKVLVSGSAYFANDIASTQLRAWTRLKNPNDENVFTVPAYTYAPEVGCNMVLNVPPVIMNVSAGQKISLMVQIGKTQKGTLMSRATTLYVEVIE